MRPGYALFAVALLISAAVFSGCGSTVRYRFPAGKTLVYEVSSVLEQEVKVKDGKKQLVPIESTRKSIELRAKATNIVGGFRGLGKFSDNYSVAVAAQPTGQDRHYAVGRDLGSITVELSRAGKTVRSYGFGVPVDLRVLFRGLPEGKARRSTKWSEMIQSKTLGEGINLKLNSSYKGWAQVDGRSCHHIQGAVTYIYEKKFKYESEQVNVKLNLNYKRDEDFYILGDGYPIKSEILETKKRILTNIFTGENLFGDIEYLKTELSLVGVE
jgi:hypothetical protein